MFFTYSLTTDRLFWLKVPTEKHEPKGEISLTLSRKSEFLFTYDSIN